ncbi:MAG: hypothetical protein ACJ714_06535 [Ornithinibacter sp.]
MRHRAPAAEPARALVKTRSRVSPQTCGPHPTTWLFGAASFELFGQLTGAVQPEQREQVLDAEVERAAAWLGLGPAARSTDRL